MTMQTTPADPNPARTADCQECGEQNREGCGRPWTDHHLVTRNPHTCFPCHDRMDEERDEAENARRKEADREAQITEQDRYWSAREMSGEW